MERLNIVNKLCKFALILAIILTTQKVYTQNEVDLLPKDTFIVSEALKQAEIFKIQGDKKEESRFYDQIGLLYWEHNFFAKAIEYYAKSQKLNIELHNLSGVSMIDHNMGMISADMKQYEKSLEYFQKALDYRRMAKDKTGTIMVLINTSVSLNNLKKYDESIKNLNEALSLAREINDMEQMKSCYGMLSETYEKAKQSDKAYYYFGFYKTFHEKLQQMKVAKVEQNIKETQLELQLSEKEKINKELELKLANSEIVEKDKDISQLDSVNKNLYSNLSRSELKKILLERDLQLKNSKLTAADELNKKQQLQIWFLLTVILISFSSIIVFAVLYNQKNRLSKKLVIQNTQIVEQKTELKIINNELFEQKQTLQKTLEELKQSQQQVIQAEKMAALGVLIAGIAHEINNPLNFIQGSIVAIESYMHDNLADHYHAITPFINGINTGLTRASAIVNSLNHYSRQDDDKKRECNIHQIIDNCLVMLTFKAKNRIEIIKDYDLTPYSLVGNESKLHQAMLNILTNAMQAIETEGIIRISTKIENERLSITIEDTGFGISDENMQKIFDPFFTTKDPGKGTGLGLSITYNIIKEHNGIIEYLSKPEKGTSAIIKLPLLN